MHQTDPIKDFYTRQLPDAELKNKILTSPCPFCAGNSVGSKKGKPGTLVVFLNPESYFYGYFRCLNRCCPGGFPIHYARLALIKLSLAPGYDPDRDYDVTQVEYPVKNLNHEVTDFTDKISDQQLTRFAAMNISRGVLTEMQIGYNGRYLVYPYFQEDGNCYAARCVHPDRPDDTFWHGNESFVGKQFNIYNCQELSSCENGTIIITEGEDNLLTLKQLGLPAIAMPVAADFVHLSRERLAWIRTIFLCVNNNPESATSARELATRLGFKIRMMRWEDSMPRNYNLAQLSAEQGTGGDGVKKFQKAVFSLIRTSKSFSPFSSPEREFLHFNEQLGLESSATYSTMTSGFAKLDQAMGGMHGINIMGGLPKAGKSCFFIQTATEMARRKVPVIYYDFENGRQKIYLRTLSRLSRLSTEQIKGNRLDDGEKKRLKEAREVLEKMLPWFRVVTDRKLTPTLMRSHIDFLRHETRSTYTMVIIDSLHKLPFKDFSERRTGIDAWLRHLEAIRDELNVSFLVISELTRGEDGQYDKQPQLGAFKGSGDIEYSADNAMVLLPKWDPFADGSAADRINELWLVASREHAPGLVGSYQLDYPFWGFREIDA